MDEQQLRQLIREEMEAVHAPAVISIQEAVRIAVRETLVTMGMDSGDPLALQQDMHFVREMRLAHEKVKNKGLLVLISILITATLTAIWLGIKSAIVGH